MLLRPYVQNIPEKNGELSPSGYSLYTHGKAAKVCPRTRCRDYISDLASSGLGVETAELFKIAGDREVFRVLLGLLSPRLSPKEKRARKLVNE